MNVGSRSISAFKYAVSSLKLKFFFFYHELLRKILYLPKSPHEGKICVILDLKRMTKKQEIQLFNDRKIRTIWDDKDGNETVTICNDFTLLA